MNGFKALKTWEMLKYVEENPEALIRSVLSNTETGLWTHLDKDTSLLKPNQLWNVKKSAAPTMSSNMKCARLGEINSTPTIVVSLKDVKTFDTRPVNGTEASYLNEIKNYNDCALFSSNHDRAAGQKDRHIHFLLKFVERITAGKAFTDEI